MSKRSQPVTVNETAINTMSVEIKALRVNKSSMTIAVFRQLPICTPFYWCLSDQRIMDSIGDITKELAARDIRLWGHVRHFFNDVAPLTKHLVWANQDTLHRCLAPLPGEYSDRSAHNWRISREQYALVYCFLIQHLPQLFIAT